MGNNQAANQRFDDAMDACGIGNKDERHRNIRSHFHQYLGDEYEDEKDEMEYKELLKVAKTFIRENYPNG